MCVNYWCHICFTAISWNQVVRQALRLSKLFGAESCWTEIRFCLNKKKTKNNNQNQNQTKQKQYFLPVQQLTYNAQLHEVDCSCLQRRSPTSTTTKRTSFLQQRFDFIYFCEWQRQQRRRPRTMVRWKRPFGNSSRSSSGSRQWWSPSWSNPTTSACFVFGVLFVQQPNKQTGNVNSHLPFSNWLLLFFTTHHRVCQLHADDFLDLGKWQRAQISHLALVDCAAQLQLARDKWIERERPFACTFVDAGTTLVTNASNQRSKFCFVLFCFRLFFQTIRLTTQR